MSLVRLPRGNIRLLLRSVHEAEKLEREASREFRPMLNKG